jgi:hypothetical protein
LAVSIAKARDALQWYGGLYAGIFSIAVPAALAGKAPKVVLAPALVGGFMLINMADMAYGNKLQRVVSEAEYIMENERERFVPPQELPFSKFYTEEEKAKVRDVPATGELWPSFFPWSR